MRFPTLLAVLAISTLALISRPALADEASKAAKLAELVKVTGMEESINKTWDFEKAKAVQQKQEVMNQFKNSFNDPDMWAYFESEYQKMIDAMDMKQTTDKAVKKYIDLYGSRMTEGEIDQVLAYEKSPAGRKSTAVSHEIQPQWMEFVSRENDARLKESLKTFIDSMKSYIAKKNRRIHGTDGSSI
jgi:hypothetical protein